MAEQDEPAAWRPRAAKQNDSGGGATPSAAQSETEANARKSSPGTEGQSGFADGKNSFDQAPDFSGTEFQNFGQALAASMEANDYHPVIVFGTNNAGKTSMLMSLFAIMRTESDRLQTGCKLGYPLLGLESTLGQRLHRDAKRLFEVGTQSFLKGEDIAATKTPYPFFVPVEFTPPNRPRVKFAFLESNGEWYRPKIEKGKRIDEHDELYQPLRPQIEQVIERYQGGITFIYIAPYTQGRVYGATDEYADLANLDSASQALVGVLKAYDAKRQGGGRALDKHLILVTKWDKRASGALRRAGEIEEDRADLQEFFARTYGEAHAEFVSVAVDNSQKALNAYCSGIITDSGPIRIDRDEETKAIVDDYAIRLWRVLYKNALQGAGQDPVEPFPLPPQPPAVVLAFRKFLDLLSGG
jgi:hypothetical protein